MRTDLQDLLERILKIAFVLRRHGNHVEQLPVAQLRRDQRTFSGRPVASFIRQRRVERVTPDSVVR